jgi:hypothetical protein
MQIRDAQVNARCKGETMHLPHLLCVLFFCEQLFMIYCSPYFRLLNNIFIFCAMAGGKRAPEGRGEPSCILTVIDLELKIKMIRKYEGGQKFI